MKFAIALLLLSGCGGDNNQSNLDLSAPPDLAPQYPASHPAMPAAQNLGGPVMANPKIVPITFMGDPLQSQIDSFTQAIAASHYWTGAASEYGVGAATALTPVHVATAANATYQDSDIQTWLKGQIMNTAGFPQPDGNTIYAIFFSTGVTVNMLGGTSCNAFNGYHNDFQIGATGTFVTYTVISRCQMQGVSLQDMMTATASHEFLEAATDPLATDNPAWATVDESDIVWSQVNGGGELGDLCAAYPDSFYKPADLNYLVQRIWSNAAAAAGHDPCEPDGTNPYFNSAPVMSDALTLNIPGFGVANAMGVKIPQGQSVTVELDLYSDAPTSGPWNISAIDFNSAFMGGPAALTFAFDQTSGQNGDKVHLTITHNTNDPSGAPFWIQNDLGNQSTVWLGVVGN